MKTHFVNSVFFFFVVSIFCVSAQAQWPGTDLTYDVVPNGNDMDLEIHLGSSTNEGPWTGVTFTALIPTDGTFDPDSVIIDPGLLKDADLTVTIINEGTEVEYDLQLDTSPGVTGHGLIMTIPGGGNLLTDNWDEKWNEQTKDAGIEGVETALILAPNPVSIQKGVFTWQVEGLTPEKAWIMDMRGSKVAVDPQPGDISMKGKQAGVYFLLVQCKEGLYSRKFHLLK